MKRMVTKMFAAGALVALVAGFMPPSLARAQVPPSEWNCFLSGQYINTVDIWWGYTPGDAQWACNNWIPACGNGGGCTAQPTSQWQCLLSGNYTGNTVSGIWWGDTPGNAQWACNNWIPACGNGGGCTTQPSTSPHLVVYYYDNSVSLARLAGSPYTDVIAAFLNPTDVYFTNLYANGGASDPTLQNDIQTLHNVGKNVLISFGGATFVDQNGNPIDMSAAYANAANNVNQLVNQIVNFVNNNGFDGVDIDYEDDCGFNPADCPSGDSSYDGVAFLVSLTNMLAQQLPGKIITHAPQTPYWDPNAGYNDNGYTAGSTAAYTQIWQQAGGNISWFNNQFYSNGYPYDDTDADKVTWYENIAAIVGSSKLMMGVALPGANPPIEGAVTTPTDFVDNVVVPLQNQFGYGLGYGGVMVWAADLDQSGPWTWAQTIAQAGNPNSVLP